MGHLPMAFQLGQRNLHKQSDRVEERPESAQSSEPHKHFYILLGGGIFIIAAIILLTAIAIFQSKTDAQKTVGITAANLTSTLVLDINNSVHEIDLGILAILDELSRQQKSGRLDEQMIISTVAREDSRHPGSIGYRIFGADGKLRYGVSNVVNRNVDFSLRDEFKRLRDDPKANLHITPSFVGPVAQERLIALARRITNPDGSFGGAVYSAIPVRSLTQLFRSLQLGPSGSVALYHSSFELAARFPEVKVGTTTISDQLRNIIASGVQATSFENLSPVDGVRRAGHVRKVDGLPYYISLALADDDWLTEWKHYKDHLIILSTILMGSVLLGIMILHRVLSNWRQAEVALAASEERTRSMDALQGSEKRFRLAVEEAPIPIMIHAEDGEVLALSRTWTDITGYSIQEIPTITAWTDKAYGETQVAVRSYISTLYGLMDRRADGEFQIRCRDGRQRVWDFSSVGLGKGSDGRHLAVSMALDVTERHQTETELRIAATALESQEGTVICDAAGVILRVNQAFSRITGYSSEEAVGKRSNLLKSGRHDPEFYRSMWDSISRDGSWTGEIWNRRKTGEIYPEWLNITAVKGVDSKVTHYVGTFSDVTHRKEAEDQIKQLAFFDPLTGLPNRRLLTDRLNQALAARTRNDREGALLFVDLDDFKKVNDTQGHETGDLLLQDVARRLITSFREADTVARLGGDEFVVLLADLSGDPEEAAAQAEIVGEKILSVLGEPYQLSGNLFRITPSVGITLFGNQRGSIDELMKQADIAMYQAKAAGRNTLRFFDPGLQETIQARVVLEAQLRQGLKEDQVLLYYQPQVDAKGHLLGAEALVRWRHPQRGLMSPAEFIPLAEETGLILSLGNRVLESGCAQIVAWTGRPETSDVTLAVNVSVRQFQQADFVEQVLDALNRTEANPSKLKLELTESLLVENVQDVIEKMFALKAKGVGFSLDDFGTGYSSLAYLKRLPLDHLKIDHSFVRDVLTDPNDAAIAKTIVTLAQSLGLGVIAEGVETSEQRDFLASSGCHIYQGYFFSKPLPADTFEQFALKCRTALKE